MTEQTGSYSIEIKKQSNEQVAIFTFTDITAGELQTLMADFRRVLGERSDTVMVNRGRRPAGAVTMRTWSGYSSCRFSTPRPV